MQGGALALLSYLVVWAVKTGAPKLFEVLMGIQSALAQNTSTLTKVEETNQQLAKQVLSMAEDISKVRGGCPVLGGGVCPVHSPKSEGEEHPAA